MVLSGDGRVVHEDVVADLKLGDVSASHVSGLLLVLLLHYVLVHSARREIGDTRQRPDWFVLPLDQGKCGHFVGFGCVEFSLVVLVAVFHPLLLFKDGSEFDGFVRVEDGLLNHVVDLG